MKKVMMIAAVMLGAFSTQAQTSFGVQAGVNLASAQIKLYDPLSNNTDEVDTKSKTGFAFGFLADVPLTTSLSFMPELNFLQKGYELAETQGSATYKEKVTLNFIEIPMNFVYKADVGMGKVFFGLGPSLGFGISGKSEESLTGFGAGIDYSGKFDVKFDGDEEATDDNRHLKSLDLGGNVVGGYMFSNGLFLKVGYTYGFSNLVPDYPAPDDKDSFKTRGFSFKIGYMFGGNNNSSE